MSREARLRPPSDVARDVMECVSAPGDLAAETAIIAADRRDVWRAALLAGAKLCYDADKNTHPSDLGDLLTRLAESPAMEDRPRL